MTPSWMDALGLLPDAVGDPDLRAALPPRAVGKALAPGGALPVARLLERPILEPALPLAELHVQPFGQEPSVVLLQVGKARVLQHAGAVVEVEAGEWVLDGREAPAAVRLRGPSGERVVVAHAHVVESYDLASLSEPPPELDTPALDLGALLQGEPIDAWLMQRLDDVSGDDVYALAVVVGTLARAWAPTDRRSALARLLQGEEGAPGRARTWAASLTPAQREELVSQAFDEVGACYDRLDEMRLASVEADPGLARRALVALVEHRERLASVQWVLGGGETVPHLDAALLALDDVARARWSERPQPTGLASITWRSEIAWREPDAWWAVP